MLMPDIHTCAKLVADNEQLKKKLRRLKKENLAFQQQLVERQEKDKLDVFLRQYVTTRNMEVQTEPVRTSHKMSWLQQPQQHPARKPVEKLTQDSERVNKLISMHSNLMKRYERELKMNVQHVETITELNLKVNQLEQKLQETKIQTQKLERERFVQNKRTSSGGRKSKRRQSACSESSLDTDIADSRELQRVRKERDKLAKENKQLKSELNGLDHGFFEEIEDLKFALQQSTRLNKEYERCLRKLCSQFGVPYPNPERRVVSSR